MRKLHLAGLLCDRDGILCALERTRAVEIEEHPVSEATAPLSSDRKEIAARLSALENALGVLSSRLSPEAKKEERREGSISLGYPEFLAMKDFGARAEEIAARVFALTEEIRTAEAESEKLDRALADARPYAAVPRPFSSYRNTKNTAVFLGTMAGPAWSVLQSALGDRPLIACEARETEGGVLLCAVCHKSVKQELEELLSSGFSACPYSDGRTGAELISSLEEAQAARLSAKRRAEEELDLLAGEERRLRIYRDFVGFELEKAEASEKMRATAHAFFLEAFVPADGEDAVKEALRKTEFPLFYEFSDPAEDEFVPTLTRNNPVVADFETITNMYSVPNAREIDPNAVMAFFYSLFLGFIMADMGYGLMMAIGGFFIRRKGTGGVKSLAGVFGVGGVFALLWGILFNSLFGVRVLPFTVMPDAQSALYSLAGIELPSVLIIALLLGIVQICAGYICKFAQCVHHGKAWDGVFDGLVWAAFSAGAFLAVCGLVTDFGVPVLVPVGGILAGASLFVAVVTAGRHEKLLGKFTKGFSSVYGLINYFTDVLSYIRLYGLMLSGAVIAQVISDYALQFFASGPALAVLGAVLMAVGHVFNLAIGLLGAYIHTARLQYVEFFGRFYEGEGRLFDPLGSHAKYVSLRSEPAAPKDAAA